MAYTSNTCISQSPIHSSSNQHKQKKLIHEKKMYTWKNRVVKSAIKQMCLVRSIDIHPTLREAWNEEVSVTSLLCSAGMSGAIHNKNQSNSLFINPSLIALRGNVCKVSFCLEWSANFTNLLNVVRAQNLCFSLQRTLWFLIQKMEFLFCCAVLWWIRASWRYLHIWPRSIFQN